MYVRRTHGIAPGILLVLLGAWVAAVPFVGPHFHYSVGATQTWHWTAGRLWLNIVPGVATLIAGLVLVGATRRGTLVAASSVAVLAGIWVVIGPQTSLLWHGTMQAGPAAGGVHRRLLEVLGYSLLSGCLIAVVASFTLGRTSVASVEDVRHDLEVRQQGLGSVAGLGSQVAPPEEPLDAAPAARSDVTGTRSTTGLPWRRRSRPEQPEVVDLRPVVGAGCRASRRRHRRPSVPTACDGAPYERPTGRGSDGRARQRLTALRSPASASGPPLSRSAWLRGWGDRSSRPPTSTAALRHRHRHPGLPHEESHHDRTGQDLPHRRPKAHRCRQRGRVAAADPHRRIDGRRQLSRDLERGPDASQLPVRDPGVGP